MFAPGPRHAKTIAGRLMRLGSAVAREPRRIDRLVSPLRRPIDRAVYRRMGKLAELAELGASVSRTQLPPTTKRVLVLTLRMWTHHAAYESVIAQALRLRGAEVTLVTCGGGQPICEVGWGRRISPRPCDRCALFTDQVAEAAGLPHARFADEFPWGSSPRRAPATLADSDRPAAAAASAASVVWFTRNADPLAAPNGSAVANDFAVSSSAVRKAFARILDRYEPDVVFALNGLFAAERTVRDVAAERGVRVVTYERSPRKDSLLFGVTSAAPEMVTDGVARDQQARALTDRENAALDALLDSRMSGAGSHEMYFRSAQDHDSVTTRRALDIPSGARIISAFTNVAWDTALQQREIGFESQFDWLAQTVAAAGKQDDAVLVVRIHPSEGRWGTDQPADLEIGRRVGRLPANARVIAASDPLSSYGLLAISDLVLGYTTTVGLEAAVRGIPVAVAGRTHYRGRGFTFDIDSPADLERVIAEQQTMTAEQVELARRYAFAFFFRLMIPFPQIRTAGDRIVELPTSADDLLPGRDRYLDFICDRILDGGDFFLPSELAVEP
jgi:Capsule polysaccharide biosynthesis protein